ncbi:MAG: alkaline shock response membrane anchor protein AmaP [Lactobacillaceae bacterium]|jgi:hypothetical protein|nr:alkaline shock response membrane anchor protein AmaP [Lactobacillaceae bacterium]
MAAWKKWWAFWVFLIQALIAGSGIALWYFQDQTWAQGILSWLVTNPGQITMVVIAGYLVLLALVTIGIAIFRPTTTKKMTIVHDGPYKMHVDQAAVEKDLRLSLASYDLYNPDVKIKMHRSSQQADVTVGGMLSQRSNPQLLQRNIQHTIAQDLKHQFNIDLRKLKVNLKPYDNKQAVAII